ncbi:MULTISPECIES: metallophosphoesterase [Niastella]|uniref:Metallophosphoesterase n=1 Tax=Niastella soli TaxID=2821487 RepID=A0ABS3YTQ6_9BACT|nr:metallophosphoesterase [Niastella soli]MBO9201299.1 metallophosphoesterase [Niastella soli]
MHIYIREETVDFHNGLESLTALHFSDIHTWFSTGILKKLKAIIFENDPALLLFTGDYFDIPRGAYLFRNFLCEIAPTYPIIFIRGNHDFFYGSRIADLLLGIPNCHCVESDIYSFTSSAGFTYHITSWDKRHYLKTHTLEKNIVLIHNPEKLKDKEMEGIDLILAGHLHGGQFILFKTINNAYFPGSLLYKYCTDRKQLRDTTLIISKGIGDTFPLRLNCPKEVIRIRIT